MFNSTPDTIQFNQRLSQMVFRVVYQLYDIKHYPLGYSVNKLTKLQCSVEGLITKGISNKDSFTLKNESRKHWAPCKLQNILFVA